MTALRLLGLAAALLVASVVNAPAQTVDSGDVVVPGGKRFIRAVVAMGAPNSDIEGGAPFMVLLARQLSAPLAVDFSRRLRDQVEELRELQRLTADLDTDFGDVTPSLAERGSTAFAKATRLLDFLGFRVVDNGERLQLQRRGSDTATRRRRLLEQLGISVPLQSRLWAAGEPILFDITDERASLMFGAHAWTEQVFGKALDGEALFNAFVEDEAARRVLAGYAALDRPTRDFLFREVGLAPLHRNQKIATGFNRVAPYLRVVNDELVFPGSDRNAWQTILDSWSDTTQLIDTLVTKNDGRAAHLWRALSLAPAPLAHYLLTMNHESAEERRRWARSLYREISTPGFGQSIRWPEDVAELFANLRLTDDGGGIAWPGGAAAWLAALSGNDPLVLEGELDELLQDFAATASSGPGVDAQVLIGILDKSDPDRGEPSAIRKFIAVSAALRYQPESSLQRAVPLLFRNYRRFGRAYGFFVTPTPLPADTAEMLIRNLHQVDGIERDEARIDAVRQFQATMMLVHRVMLNDLLTDDDREALLDGFLDLPLTSGGSRNTAATEDYGTALTEWWRAELIPALGRGLVANGWSGNPGDARMVLVTALVGRIGVSPIEVDGIEYNFAPAATLGERMYIHLLTQEQPSFVNLFRLDEIAQFLQTGTVDARFAGEIESKAAELETQMPPDIGDAEIDAALQVSLSRAELFERADTLVAELRADSAGTATIEAFRAAVSSYMADALIGFAYALHMGDPAAFTYQQGHLAWLHRFEIADLPDDAAPESLFGPWAATAESWIMNEGSRLHNSLFGAPATVSRWNLENSMAGGMARDPAAAEAWAATLAYIHIPSLTAEAQSVIAQRHDLATSWIGAAVAARDPELVPAFWVAATPAQEPPALATTLRRLMHPDDVQRFEDAVSEGRRDAALRMVTAGNRYLLLRLLDNNDVVAPAAARWLIDQAVGMPVLRRGDYLGLRTPAPVPHGEAGDNLADALLYTRVFDVRVQLSVLMEKEGLPAALHARLLTKAMARVLSTMRPGAWDTWRNLLAAINAEITDAAVRQWVVDLAFADELRPTDPELAMERAAATGPAGSLVLPVDVSQYPTVFGAEINMVTIDVGVWDHDDNFVANLTIEDFTVEREGGPVTAAYVRLEGSPQPSVFLDDLPDAVTDQVALAPRNFVLIADMLTTSPQDWNRILLDVSEFVRAGINVEDRLALVTIDDKGVPTINHNFTQDHERVAETLEVQIGNAVATQDLEQSFRDLTDLLCDNGMCSPENACEAMATPRFPQCITQNPDWEERKFQMAQSQLGRWATDSETRSRLVIAALTQIGSMLELGDPIDRQKILLLLSSGFERLPGDIHYQTLVEYANFSPSLNPMEVGLITNDVSDKISELTNIMRRCRCAMYSLGTLGNTTFTPASGVTAAPPIITRMQVRGSLQGALTALSLDTGGKPFFGSDMSDGFTDVLEDTRLRYVIGLVMEQDVDPDAEPEWIGLSVKVDRNDVEVRARQGFYWPRR